MVVGGSARHAVGGVAATAAGAPAAVLPSRWLAMPADEDRARRVGDSPPSPTELRKAGRSAQTDVRNAVAAARVRARPAYLE
jgi:hypothetical protein